MNRIQLFFIALFSVILLGAKEYPDFVTTNKNTSAVIDRIGNADMKVKMPDYIFENTNTTIELQFVNPANTKLIANNYALNFILNGQEFPVQFDQKGSGIIHYSFKNGESASILFEDFSYQKDLNIISLWMILLPIGFILLIVMLRFLNVRAKKKIANKNLKAIEATKATEVKKNPETIASKNGTQNAKTKRTITVEEEEEMLA